MFALFLAVGRNYGIIRGMDDLKKIMYGVTVAFGVRDTDLYVCSFSDAAGFFTISVSA